VSARRFVVTGANCGVGRSIAESLAADGHRVVLACRSEARAQDVLRSTASTPGAVELVRLDLGDLASVRAAADRIARAPVDVLINNAGVGGARGRTADGFELAFGVNFVGHFALTRALEAALAPDGRVVSLGSGSHEQARAVDLVAARRPTRSLTGIPEYAVSKLCVMLFAAELARRFAGTGRKSVVADPGDVASEAYRHVPWPARAWILCGLSSPDEGARTPLWCATSPDARNGALYADGREREPSPLATDAALARALWAWAERAT